MSSVIRAFAAVPVDSHLKPAIQDLQMQLQTLIPTKTVRWTRPEQLHLTLKFYGSVASDQVSALTAALQDACDGIAPFSLSLDGVGCFPSSKRPAVVWLGVRGDLSALDELQKKIDLQTKAFCSKDQARDFRPHLTIGRVQASRGAARILGQIIENRQITGLGEWKVREVDLTQSTLSVQGSTYLSLGVMHLGSP